MGLATDLLAGPADFDAAEDSSAGFDPAADPQALAAAALLEAELEAELETALAAELEADLIWDLESDLASPPGGSPDSSGEAFEISDVDVADEPPPQVRTAGATTDPVRDYLQLIGRIPLLTAQQEVQLAIRIECGVLAEEKLTSGAPLGPLVSS